MEKLSILLMTCNEYKDLMPYQNALFDKYWKDCPYKRYIVVDECDEKYSGYEEIIIAGKDKKNCQRLNYALQKIKTPYVLIIQEDFLLCDYVDTDVIAKMVDNAEKYNAGNVRLVVDPKPTGEYSENSDLVYYEPGMAYRISTRTGIWDTEYIKWLSGFYKDLWSLEREGSFKSQESAQPILGTKYQSYPFEDAIHKGKWDRPAVRLLSRNKMDIDFEKRKEMTEWDYVREHFKGWIISLNPKKIVSVQNRLKIGKR